MRIDDGTVRRITFDRLDVHNAMSADVARDLADALADINATDHDAVVITGEGDETAIKINDR